MSLERSELFGTYNRVDEAIKRIRYFESTALQLSPNGYFVAFSGGKDSVALLDLVRKAGVQHRAQYNYTTVDPPELTTFIRQKYPTVDWSRPKETMWSLIVKKRFPPTRKVRYCCEHLKEQSGDGCLVLTGVRWEESSRRKTRRLFEACYRNARKHYLHPLIDWTESDVWEYIRREKLAYCTLYDEGFKRIGCVGCPMARREGQLAEFARWPGFKRAYILAFEKMIAKNKADGKVQEWKTGQEVFDWWIANSVKGDPDQTSLFE